mgnify:CR=1 FL=1
MTKRLYKKSAPLVSIIIPTRNSIRTIEICLKSIRNQKYKQSLNSPERKFKNLEIIVVDQESKDGTQEIAKKYTNKVMVTKGDKFYSAPPVSRNMGAKISRGKYLLHIDSDMELTPLVVSKGVEIFESEPDILALKIHEKDVGQGFWSRAKILERKCYIGYDAIEAARFFRREVFFKLGGYDEKLRSSEDWDMSKRVNAVGKIDSIPLPYFTKHHLGRLKYLAQVKKKFNYGLTLDTFLTKHGFNFKKEFQMVFRIAYFQNILLFIKDPIATLGFLILRPSELTSYLTGLIWAKIKKIEI